MNGEPTSLPLRVIVPYAADAAPEVLPTLALDGRAIGKEERGPEKNSDFPDPLYRGHGPFLKPFRRKSLMIQGFA